MSSPLEAGGAAEILLSPVFVPPAISNRSALARALHADRCFGRVGHLTLQSDGAPRRIQHFEQPFVEGLGPRVGGTLSDALAEVGRSGLDGGTLPGVHRVQL